MPPELQLKNTEVEVNSWQCDNWEAGQLVGHHDQRLEAHVHGHGGGRAEHEHDDVDELVEEEVEQDQHGAHAEGKEDDKKGGDVDMSVLKMLFELCDMFVIDQSLLKPSRTRNGGCFLVRLVSVWLGFAGIAASRVTRL